MTIRDAGSSLLGRGVLSTEIADGILELSGETITSEVIVFHRAEQAARALRQLGSGVGELNRILLPTALLIEALNETIFDSPRFPSPDTVLDCASRLKAPLVDPQCSIKPEGHAQFSNVLNMGIRAREAHKSGNRNHALVFFGHAIKIALEISRDARALQK